MAVLTTTLGPKTLADLGPGPILPHELVFVDLWTWDQPGYGATEPSAGPRPPAAEIERAGAFGVRAIVEPSTVGVGRRADILLAVSRATGFPLVAPTGADREPWLPPWVREAVAAALRDWAVGELSGEIAGTGVRAGWIKVGASDEGITLAEAKLLRAAAGASAATGAAVGSHTLRGRSPAPSSPCSKRPGPTRPAPSGSTPTASRTLASIPSWPAAAPGWSTAGSTTPAATGCSSI